MLLLKWPLLLSLANTDCLQGFSRVGPREEPGNDLARRNKVEKWMGICFFCNTKSVLSEWSFPFPLPSLRRGYCHLVLFLFFASEISISLGIMPFISFFSFPCTSFPWMPCVHIHFHVLSYLSVHLPCPKDASCLYFLVLPPVHEHNIQICIFFCLLNMFHWIFQWCFYENQSALLSCLI